MPVNLTPKIKTQFILSLSCLLPIYKSYTMLERYIPLLNIKNPLFTTKISILFNTTTNYERVETDIRLHIVKYDPGLHFGT